MEKFVPAGVICKINCIGVPAALSVTMHPLYPYLSLAGHAPMHSDNHTLLFGRVR